MSELKPCPFCGGNAKRITDNRIKCSKCGIRTFSNQSYLSNERFWNTRFIPPEPKTCETGYIALSERDYNLLMQEVASPKKPTTALVDLFKGGQVCPCCGEYHDSTACNSIPQSPSTPQSTDVETIKRCLDNIIRYSGDKDFILEANMGIAALDRLAGDLGGSK